MRTNINLKKGGTITVNGVTYSGNNLNISGNKIVIDGKQVNIETGVNIKIDITGDCESVQCTSGDIKCGHVGGNIKTISGDIINR